MLEYFQPAVQIGLTATPKETKDVSNIDYFGVPIYTYSLRQSIDDGFLAPFRVVHIDIAVDVDVDDAEGRRVCGSPWQRRARRSLHPPDFDRTLVLDDRTRLVALRTHGRMQKTIVLCEDIDHAERMRQALANENADLVTRNWRYVVRITGDNDVGKVELDNFIDPASPYPAIAIASRLMSTGVDAQTCHLIVLDRTINSIPEFKQIIGRGTRIREDYGKLFFTIMDFRNVTRLFADPDFDGDPVEVYTGGAAPLPDDGPGSGAGTGGDGFGGDGDPGSKAGGEDGSGGRTKY